MDADRTIPEPVRLAGESVCAARSAGPGLCLRPSAVSLFFHPARIASLLMGLHVVAAGAATTNQVEAASELPASLRGFTVRATVLRHRPASGASIQSERLSDCRSVPELLQVLRPAGAVEILGHFQRETVCDPVGQLDFRAVESRPVMVFTDAGGIPTNRVHGFELSGDLRVLQPGMNGSPPWIHAAWQGSWSGSVSLLFRWETLALRGFNAARTVPGITYQKMEEDEDGFVNTGGGTDVSRFFKRKNKKEKKPGTKVDTGKPPPAAQRGKAAPADPVNPSGAGSGSGVAEHEPSYLGDDNLERVTLRGEWIGPSGGLLVTRVALKSGQPPGDLYVVLQFQSLDP